MSPVIGIYVLWYSIIRVEHVYMFEYWETNSKTKYFNRPIVNQ